MSALHRQVFLVTGLPRSRSAWLSVFLTHGGVACRHEALRPDLSAEGLSRRLSETPGRVVGNADSGMALLAEPIARAFPEARVAIVERSPLEVERSLVALHGRPELARQVVTAGEAGLARLGELMETRHFRFDRLGDPEELARLWEWCAPAEPFPYWRVSELETLQIEQRPELVRAEVEAIQTRTSSEGVQRGAREWRS